MEFATITISILALLISVINIWVSYFRRGKLKMTRPTTIFFGPDGGEGEISKVYLRALLYSTGERGIVLEHLFVRLRRGETQQNFNIWVYGEKNLARGSGIYVGPEGVATNHHFLIPTDIHGFEFSAGAYGLDVFGKIVGQKDTSLLLSIRLEIDRIEAEKLRQPDQGIYFDWGPDAGCYQKKIEGKPSKAIDSLGLLEMLRAGSATDTEANNPRFSI